jgi:hypothetical protein
MHALTLAELASTLAFHGPGLLYRPEAVQVETIHSYWIASRARHEQWHTALASGHAFQQCGDAAGYKRWWEKQQGLLEEVLVSEILTRTIAALGMALDRWSGHAEISPISDSVLASHQESRHRVLKLLAHSSPWSNGDVVRMNLLRSSVEHWSDLLVGYVAVFNPYAVRCAIDSRRALKHTRDAAESMTSSTRRTGCWLFTAAMRENLGRRVQGGSFASEQNQRIADAVMLCLRPDLYDSTGAMKGLFLHRLEHSSEQADRVVEALSDLAANVPLLDGYEAIHRRG